MKSTKKKRSLATELLQGIDEIKHHRAGKITLRSSHVEEYAVASIDAATIRDTRERLGMSQAVFARKLCTKKRTLEKWEHGRSRPNDQAAALIMLVRKYPDTVGRLSRALSQQAGATRGG